MRDMAGRDLGSVPVTKHHSPRSGIFFFGSSLQFFDRPVTSAFRRHVMNYIDWGKYADTVKDQEKDAEREPKECKSS